MKQTIRPLIFSAVNGVLVPFNGKKKDMYDEHIVKYEESAIYALKEFLRLTNGLLILLPNTLSTYDMSIINQMLDNGIEVYKILSNPLYSNGELISEEVRRYTDEFKIPCIYAVFDIEDDKYSTCLKHEQVNILNRYSGWTLTEARLLSEKLNLYKEGVLNMLKNAILTKEESYSHYTEYVEDHVRNVIKAYDLFIDLLISYIEKYKRSYRFGFAVYDRLKESVRYNLTFHDKSKFSANEFAQYAAKFYPCPEDIENIKQTNENFDAAWEHHWKNNPHHPEYWLEVDEHGKEKYREMSNAYFIEMILDWISVSMTKKSSTFDWWFNHNGRTGKVDKLTALDIDLIDEFLTTYKEATDFSE